MRIAYLRCESVRVLRQCAANCKKSPRNTNWKLKTLQYCCELPNGARCIVASISYNIKQCLAPRWNWDSPTPLPKASVPLPQNQRGWEHWQLKNRNLDLKSPNDAANKINFKKETLQVIRRVSPIR